MGIEQAGKIFSTSINRCKMWVTKLPQGKLRYVCPPVVNNTVITAKSMSKQNAVKLLSNNRIRAFSFKNQQVPMKIFGQEKVGQWINGGGSKCAYRVNINGEDICVLLPHQNWVEALNEPQNTLILKNLGLLTNDYCKIIPAEIEGNTVPVLISKPYDKHSFKIFDKKNPNDYLEKYFDLNQMREDNIEAVFGDLIKDVKILVDNNICLGYDSFNLALKDGKLRLYLNDLPYETLTGDSPKKEFLTELYFNYVMDSVPSSFSMQAEKTNSMLKKLNCIDGQDKLMPKFLEIFNKL